MYESPIEIIDDIYNVVTKTVLKAAASGFDEMIYNAIIHAGVKVDKGELLRALEYDRGQYEKGFEDGVNSVDAEPVRHGHWVDAYPDIEANPMFAYGICSICGFEQSISDELPYCPNCGAKMEVSKC